MLAGPAFFFPFGLVSPGRGEGSVGRGARLGPGPPKNSLLHELAAWLVGRGDDQRAHLARLDVWLASRTSSLAARPDEPEADSAEALMTRYVDGDFRAFETLYARLGPKLFGYLLRLTRDRARAEDLVQTTFIKLHRARSSYLKGAPILPWLLAIARRSFLDERRRARVRPEDLSFDGNVPEPKGASTDEADRDRAEVLELALSKIPESYAEAIQLTKITGLSIAEAAEVLGTTQVAVKLRVHRGYALLRRELAELGGNA